MSNSEKKMGFHAQPHFEKDTKPEGNASHNNGVLPVDFGNFPLLPDNCCHCLVIGTTGPGKTMGVFHDRWKKNAAKGNYYPGRKFK